MGRKTSAELEDTNARLVGLELVLAVGRLSWCVGVARRAIRISVIVAIVDESSERSGLCEARGWWGSYYEVMRRWVVGWRVTGWNGRA